MKAPMECRGSHGRKHSLIRWDGEDEEFCPLCYEMIRREHTGQVVKMRPPELMAINEITRLELRLGTLERNVAGHEQQIGRAEEKIRRLMLAIERLPARSLM